MSEKDLKLASKIGHWLHRFPDEWQDYQDWLRDITVSLSDLQCLYPAWQATLIFRWRLVYFLVYVSSLIVIHRLQRICIHQRTITQPDTMAEETTVQSARTLFIWQRMATLLAVSALTLCGIAALTGILLAFYYEPTAIGAHYSLTKIATQVSNGSLILSLHNLAGNGLIALSIVQLVVMFLGRQLQRSWFTAWISGILLTISAMGLSWTAIVLSWDQVGFWRFKIELGMIESIPLVGSGLRAILTGGDGISSVTLQHMHTLHSYVLAIAAILLSITHLASLIFQERNSQQTEIPLRPKKMS
ncbi:MAG: cytochrome b N-terminal domain-containing protein [Cyanobacteria bacterium P01_H01_bin.105]